MVYCSKCGCTEDKYFGINNNQLYCRRCIVFKDENVKEKGKFNTEIVKPRINYPLTKEQKELSFKVVEAFRNKKDVLIYAVCGAGKTEIVFEVIADCLNKKKQVGFAIPRKDVVIELESRIKDAFPDSKVVSVYGGHEAEVVGDIILLTTHQLFRYKKYFDLLIIDETDAFPFSNNEVLMHMFEESLKGNYIMMSATPLKWMKDKIKKDNGVSLSLLKRFHGHKIVEPVLKVVPFFQILVIIELLTKYRKENKPCLIFVPTKYDGENLFKLLKNIFSKIDYVHSSKEDRQEVIDMFKKGYIRFLITTSILERGITIKNIQVIVYKAEHELYTKEVLIQISGRVGRKIDSYDGDVVFVAKKSTVFIENAIKEIREANMHGIL